MRVLLTGAGGQVGKELHEVLSASRQHEVLAFRRDELDITDRERVLQVFGQWAPEIVVNSAAFTAVDACESDPETAFRVNALGPRHLAEAARSVAAHMVHISTDYVFDGRKQSPYLEWDEPCPLSVYGRSKLAGEREALQQLPGAAIVRTSWVCGRYGANIVKTVLRLAGVPGPLRFVDDQRGCPTFADDLATMLARLALARLPGVFHVTNQGTTTWAQFAREVVAGAGGDPGRVEAIKTSELVPSRPAPRPANSVLENAAIRSIGWPLLPDYHIALQRTLRWLQAQPAPVPAT